MKFDIWKTILAGFKFFAVSLVGVIVAALGMAITGYVPANPLEIVLWTYAAQPIINGVIGALQNLIKHING